MSSVNKVGNESHQTMLDRIENARDCFKNSIAKLDLDQGEEAPVFLDFGIL